MAERVWGAGTGLGTNNSYSTASNWTGDTLPANGDDVIFNGTSVEDCTGGMAQGGVDLHSFTVTEDYTGTIGATGSHLVISVSNGTDPTFRFSGPGEAWIEAGASNIDKAYVFGTGSGSDILSLDSALAQEITDLTVFGGNVTILASGDVPNLSTGFVDSAPGDAVVTIEDGATLATVTCGGGKIVNTNNNITTLQVHAGTITNAEDADITTLVIRDGIVKHTGGGTVTTLTLIGGTFDASGSPGCTITNRIQMFAGSVLNLENGANNIVIDADILYLGGTLIFDRGTVVTAA